jgi:hypothetical protein
MRQYLQLPEDVSSLFYRTSSTSFSFSGFPTMEVKVEKGDENEIHMQLLIPCLTVVSWAK